MNATPQGVWFGHKTKGAILWMIFLSGVGLVCVSITGHKVHDEQEDTSELVTELADSSINYGFAPDDLGEEPTMVKIMTPLFGYNTAGSTIHKLFSSASHTQFDVKESLTAAQSALSVSAGISGSYGAFSASVKASTSNTDSSSTRMWRADKYISVQKWIVTSSDVNASANLLPSARTFLLTKSPAEIVARYGAFYSTQLKLGATYRSTFTKRRTASDTTSSFKASVAAKVSSLMASASVTAGTSVSSGSSLSTAEIKCTTFSKGGDPAIWLGLTSNNLDAIQKKWAQSVTNSNLVPISYKLAFVWDLVKALDSVKGAALQTYTMNKWKKEITALGLVDSAAYAKAKISVVYGTTSWWKWDDSGSGAYTDIRVDQPQPKWSGSTEYFAQGDIAEVGDHLAPNSANLPMYAGDIKHPTYWSLGWTDAGSGGTHDCKMWTPSSDNGYTCTGVAVTSSASVWPDSYKYACFPTICIEWVSTSVWYRDSGSGANADLSVYKSPQGSSYFFSKKGYYSSQKIPKIKSECTV